MRRVTVLVLAICGGCASDAFQETPFVQPSADAKPSWFVYINRVIDGVYQSYDPRCEDSLKPRDLELERPWPTVEFQNFMPEIPTNVSSISGPEILYSPNLVRPYNYVGPEDPDNTLCDIEGPQGCQQRPAWSYWRFTFTTSGVYDWIDTNQGSPGRQIVDPYYGTVTFIGLDPDSPFGTLCVQEQDGSGCEAVCCTSDANCKSKDGTICINGRCLTPSG